jgi:hypothetical protein
MIVATVVFSLLAAGMGFMLFFLAALLRDASATRVWHVTTGRRHHITALSQQRVPSGERRECA